MEDGSVHLEPWSGAMRLRSKKYLDTRAATGPTESHCRQEFLVPFQGWQALGCDATGMPSRQKHRKRRAA